MIINIYIYMYICTYVHMYVYIYIHICRHLIYMSSIPYFFWMSLYLRIFFTYMEIGHDGLGKKISGEPSPGSPKTQWPEMLTSMAAWNDVLDRWWQGMIFGCCMGCWDDHENNRIVDDYGSWIIWIIIPYVKRTRKVLTDSDRSEFSPAWPVNSMNFCSNWGFQAICCKWDKQVLEKSEFGCSDHVFSPNACRHTLSSSILVARSQVISLPTLPPWGLVQFARWTFGDPSTDHRILARSRWVR